MMRTRAAWWLRHKLELAAAEKAEKLTKDYRAALRMLDAGSWQEAVIALQQIDLADPGYRDTAALLARVRTWVSDARKPSPQIRAIVKQPKVVLHHPAQTGRGHRCGVQRRWPLAGFQRHRRDGVDP